MTVRFRDLQDQSNPAHGATICQEREFLELLMSLRSRVPFVGELVGDNGYKLTIGFGQQYGFVQHSQSDGRPPYLVAVARDECNSAHGANTFLAGDTPTPIQRRYCLPLADVAAIALEFIADGVRSREFSWEEI